MWKMTTSLKTSEKWYSTCFLVGIIMTDNQSRGYERESLFTHASFSDCLTCPDISCLKTQKGVHYTSPNQNNSRSLQLANGYTMACCLDGHGPDRHRVNPLSENSATFPLTDRMRWKKAGLPDERSQAEAHDCGGCSKTFTSPCFWWCVEVSTNRFCMKLLGRWPAAQKRRMRDKGDEHFDDLTTILVQFTWYLSPWV